MIAKTSTDEKLRASKYAQCRGLQNLLNWLLDFRELPAKLLCKQEHALLGGIRLLNNWSLRTRQKDKSFLWCIFSKNVSEVGSQPIIQFDVIISVCKETIINFRLKEYDSFLWSCENMSCFIGPHFVQPLYETCGLKTMQLHFAIFVK